jgi:hypothetical protein
MTSEMEKPRLPLLGVYLLVVVVQQCNYIVALPLQHCIEYNYIVALPLPTSRQPTMVGVAFSISEVV